MRSRRFHGRGGLTWPNGCGRSGLSNSLALKLLTLTRARCARLYQGTELWDLSLVDPDNRRPVDYRQRATSVERSRLRLTSASCGPKETSVA